MQKNSAPDISMPFQEMCRIEKCLCNCNILFCDGVT